MRLNPIHIGVFLLCCLWFAAAVATGGNVWHPVYVFGGLTAVGFIAQMLAPSRRRR